MITAIDVTCIYELPLGSRSEGLDERICELLNIWSRAPALAEWEPSSSASPTPTAGDDRRRRQVRRPADAYKSSTRRWSTAASPTTRASSCSYIDAEEIEQGRPGAARRTSTAILVPGGFGERGLNGKLRAIRWARENGVPFFGICLGMQMAVAEFARNVAGMEGANSTEFDPKTPHPVIDLMEQQKQVEDKGGTMRLGAYPCHLTEGSRAHECYGELEVSERHRHRYEVNNDYREHRSRGGGGGVLGGGGGGGGGVPRRADVLRPEP